MDSLKSLNLPSFLEAVYQRYHREEYIDPDPLLKVRTYHAPEDREVAAFICASLALGRVRGILRACDSVLSPFGTNVKESLLRASPKDLSAWFMGFRYRFFGAEEIVSFLSALQRVLGEYGTLESCFASGVEKKEKDPFRGIEKLYREMESRRTRPWGILLSDPAKGGAMKRWHLFLRWMVRKDQVDPGGWRCIDPSILRVPMDTHLYRWSRGWGITKRKTLDQTTVEEVTAAFRAVDPKDPTRFDFSLSRLGISPANWVTMKESD